MVRVGGYGVSAVLKRGFKGIFMKETNGADVLSEIISTDRA
jgi:hypothetical protein